MNDADFEAWLAARFQCAPSPEPSPRLQRAVASDRVGATMPRSRAPSHTARLFGHESRLAGLIGLAVAAILAVAALGIAVGRLPEGNAGSHVGIRWQAQSQVPTESVWGPYVATVGGHLYMMVGHGGAAEVWSSADGVTWSRASEPATFESDFVPRAMSDDGAGGLVIVGDDLVGQFQTPTPVMWHSLDGRSFALAQVEVSTGAEIAGVAARPGQIVALGDHGVGTSYTLDAWYSADGTTWSHVNMPEATGYQAIAVTAWTGGFAAVANDTLGQNPAVWTSVDGRSWQKSPAVLTGFAPTSIVAFKDRVILLGAGTDVTDGASWSSIDGRNWVESIAPARDPATMIDAATVVGDTLVAIGSSHLADQMIMGGPTMPPVGLNESVWLSKDGVTWQLLPADGSVPQVQGLFCLQAFENWAVLATATPGGTVVNVFLGDIEP